MSKKFNQKIGSQLKNARIQKNYSCQHMADYLKCAKSTYFYYEDGDYSISIESLIKACTHLGLDWVEVVNNAKK